MPRSATWYSFDASHQPVRLQIDPPGDAAGRPRPVGNLPIEHAPVEELRRSLATFPHGAEIAKLVEGAYGPGVTGPAVTMTQGFRALLRRMLPEIDLPTLDPLDPAIRSLAGPFLAEALAAAPELKARLLERSAELIARPIAITPRFWVEPGRRRSSFCSKTASECLCAARIPSSRRFKIAPPENFAECPAAAGDAGLFGCPPPPSLAVRASLRIWPSPQVLYDRLLGRMPVVLARASTTLLDTPAPRNCSRAIGSLCPKPWCRRAPCGKGSPPRWFPPASKTLWPILPEASSDRRLSRLSEELERFDPTLLAASLAKSRAKMTYQLEKVRRKTAREILRRDARAPKPGRNI